MKLGTATAIALMATVITTAMAGRPKAVGFKIERGTNLSHWLSQTDSRASNAETFITEKDFRQIASWGFDHVRIPVDEMILFEDNGARNIRTLTLLKNALDWCVKYRLRAVVDLHILRSHHFNAKKKPLFTDANAQARFYDIWEALSDELAKYPLKYVAYELMNEPVADKDDEWNRIALECYRVIRNREPRRVIVMGANRWQSFDRLKNLVVPQDDPNIILSFHYYNPMMLTHYTASWTDLKNYRGGVHYPGRVVTSGDLASVDRNTARQFGWWATQTYNRERIKGDFMQAVEVARKHGLRLYCGEFGALSAAPEADRLRWYSDMLSLFEELDIAHANWDYRSGGFGFAHQRDGGDNALLKLLAPKPKAKIK